VLSLGELNNVLVAAQRIDYPWGPLVEMLVYTGQRLDEVAQATWQEFDLVSQIWALSGSRTKNGRPHVVHLSDVATSTILALPQVGGQSWLFSTTGIGPVKGFSKVKAKLDKESGVTNWTFHDLRRTFATFTTDKLQIGPVVIDKVLNHASGGLKGIAAVYQRGEYLNQRKTAMACAKRLAREQGNGLPFTDMCCICLPKPFLGSILHQMRRPLKRWLRLMRTPLFDAIGPVGPVSEEGIG